MDLILVTAIVLILGTVLTYGGFGSFPPIIYTGKDMQEKLTLLAAQPRRWTLSQYLVILGGLVSAAGTVLLVFLFRGSRGFLPAWIGAAGFVLGHVFWIWIVILRIVKPQRQATGEFPGWLFPSFSFLAQLGLAGFGAAFCLQGVHPVLGIGIIAGSVLVFILFLKTKGMPPFVYYLMTLIIGVALVFS